MMPRIIVGDCFEALTSLEADPVDAVVTDPPYGLGFMGKKWDQVDYRFYLEWAVRVLPLLKPGGHLLAFGGTRTFHRLTCALEDAGFEIRDCLMWLYGSGFPKSLDVSKAIDKAAGAGREVVGRSARHGGGTLSGAAWNIPADVPNATAPATYAAKQWSGWGTALKPAWEPIILARKPLSEPTVAANMLKWGTGALNIDGTRIAGTVPTTVHGVSSRQGEVYGKFRDEPQAFVPNGGGRWPANLILDEEATAMLDEQSGKRPTSLSLSASRGKRPSGFGNVGAERGDSVPNGPTYGDFGGASRFFYCAKTSRSEREAGLETLKIRSRGMSNAAKSREEYDRAQSIGLNKVAKLRNIHPTVKPISLMRYLCRLVTPPNGVILDPFAGTFTTGIAAVLEGFDYVMIEKDPKYVEIGLARLDYWIDKVISETTGDNDVDPR